MSHGRVWAVLSVDLLLAAACASPPPRPVADPAPASFVPTPSASASASSARPPPPAALPCRVLPKLPPLPALEREAGPSPAYMPGLMAGLPADAPAPLVAACDKLATRSRAHLRTRPGFRPKDPIPPAQRRGPCYGDARGAWALDAEPFRSTGAPGQRQHEAAWELVFVTPQGKVVRSPGARGTSSDGEYGGTGVAIAGLADFDGDGVVEVLVDAMRWSIAAPVRSEVSGWALRGGAITALPEAFFVGWRDVDGDGRTDRLRRGPPGDETTPLVDHGLPGGRFSSDDLVAQAAWQRLCPKPPEGPLDGLRAVSCGLVWGQDRAEIARRIEETTLTEECRRAHLAALDANRAGPLLVGACGSNEPALPRDEVSASRAGCFRETAEPDQPTGR